MFVVVKGFSVTWDNVQRMAFRRHVTSLLGNKFHLWALSFLTENRIGFLHLYDNEPTRDASLIPLHHFLPSEEDWTMLRQRMEVIVERLIVEICDGMTETFYDCVTYHVPHQYTKESSEKSYIVSVSVHMCLDWNDW